jgi:hypothetical protein
LKGIIMTSNTSKSSVSFDINAEFRSVMHELGLSPEDTGGSITFVGEDPIFPTKHRLGACIAIPIMAGQPGSPTSGVSAPAAARTSP